MVRSFAVRLVVALVLLMLLWRSAAPWLAHPAAVLVHMALEFWAQDWVESLHKILNNWGGLDKVEVLTRLMVSVPGGRGELVVEADPARYGYSWPLLCALLVAVPGQGVSAVGTRWGFVVSRALLGYVLLLPVQAFCLCFDLLKQIAVAMPGGARALGISGWQLDGIALGWQFGALLAPTLVPVLLWLWLDRHVMAGWFGMHPHKPTADAKP